MKEKNPMKKEYQNKCSMKHSAELLPVILATVLALILGFAVPDIWAGGHHKDNDDDEMPFAEAHLFFELNNTDGDLGIHALIDGEAWKRLRIEDPRERKMLDVKVKGRLRKQGLTEFFFESAEPTFEKLSPDEFFDRFPEGWYEIEGKTLEGDEMESEVWLSHVMPAPANGIRLNGEAVDLETVDCEDDEDTVPTVDAGTVVIAWDPVTMSHPDPNGGGAAVPSPVDVTIHNYEVVVEVELEVDGEEFSSVFSIILPPDETQITIPAEFIAQGDEFKYEILAREQNYNQTAVESCFVAE
jgi:hypothetical protein